MISPSKRLRFRAIFVALFLIASLPARGAGFDELLTLDEFRTLTRDLAPKVNLFHEAWEKDPKAEMFGGTSRDFLYWIKGKFQGVTTREQALETCRALRALPLIDVRDFIVGDSDVDIITSGPRLAIEASTYGLRKIDTVDRARLDPTTAQGKTEREQGYLPMEKIRLGKDGLRAWPEMGDGVFEVWRGRPTAHFAPPEQFWETHYARLGVNHPILLAMRYLRLVAMDYFHRKGAGAPDASLLEMDPASHDAVIKTVNAALPDPRLAKLLVNPDFVRRMNMTAHQAFRSYTSPTAAAALFKHFGVDGLWSLSSDLLPTNQYLTARRYDPAEVEKNLATFHVDAKAFFIPVADRFPDGYLYHGTRKEEAFRNILFQGTLPSEGGSAGAGLYGVPYADRGFSENWAGNRDRLVRIPLAPGTKLVDITRGEGARVFRAFGGNEEAFAAAFGIDVIGYPYWPAAYVVKNSAVLGKPEGVYRQMMTVSTLLVLAREAKTKADLFKVSELMKLNRLTDHERAIVRRALEPLLEKTISETLGPEEWKALTEVIEPALWSKAVLAQAAERVAGESWWNAPASPAEWATRLTLAAHTGASPLPDGEAGLPSRDAAEALVQLRHSKATFAALIDRLPPGLWHELPPEKMGWLAFTWRDDARFQAILGEALKNPQRTDRWLAGDLLALLPVYSGQTVSINYLVARGGWEHILDELTLGRSAAFRKRFREAAGTTDSTSLDNFLFLIEVAKRLTRRDHGEKVAGDLIDAHRGLRIGGTPALDELRADLDGGLDAVMRHTPFREAAFAFIGKRNGEWFRAHVGDVHRGDSALDHRGTWETRLMRAHRDCAAELRAISAARP